MAEKLRTMGQKNAFVKKFKSKKVKVSLRLTNHHAVKKYPMFN